MHHILNRHHRGGQFRKGTADWALQLLHLDIRLGGLYKCFRGVAIFWVSFSLPSAYPRQDTILTFFSGEMRDLCRLRICLTASPLLHKYAMCAEMFKVGAIS